MPPASSPPPLVFGAAIAAEYGVQLPFFDGSLSEARQMAEVSGQYLLIYLHCPSHEDTTPFLTKTLASTTVQSAILAKVVLFGISVMTPEGQRLAEAHHVCVYPALVCLLRHMEVLRLEGDWCRDENGLLREWEASTTVWDAQLAQEISTRADREAREAARLAEENAMSEMEKEDMRRLAAMEEREKREAEARKAAEEAAAAAAEEATRQRKAAEAEAERQRVEAEAKARVVQTLEQVIATAQSAARERLPPAPPEDSSAEQVCVVSVKGLTGKPHTRRFWRHDVVDAVYDYALAEEDVPTLVKHLEGHDGDALAVAQDTWLQLAAGFPPAPLVWEKGTTICGDVRALCPRATVLVRKGTLLSP